MANLTIDQLAKFQGYQSLDLTNKIYQVKTLRLISSLLPYAKSHMPYAILELGSADDSFLELVCKEINGHGLGLDLTKGDDLEKPLKQKSNTADLIIALEVIEHLFDTDQFLSEIYRVLKPKGVLILSTPNLASLANRLRLLFGGYPKYLEFSRAGAGHIHLYTPTVISRQLAANSFKIIKLTSPNFLCPYITEPWFPAFLKEFFMALGDLFPSFGSHLLVVARKNA